MSNRNIIILIMLMFSLAAALVTHFGPYADERISESIKKCMKNHNWPCNGSKE